MTAALRDMREIVRDEMVMHAPILHALSAGPLTIPEIAGEIGEPANEVLVWVMGMLRFRLVVVLPDADDDGFFRYAGVAAPLDAGVAEVQG